MAGHASIYRYYIIKLFRTEDTSFKTSYVARKGQNVDHNDNMTRKESIT